MFAIERTINHRPSTVVVEIGDFTFFLSWHDISDILHKENFWIQGFVSNVIFRRCRSDPPDSCVFVFKIRVFHFFAYLRICAACYPGKYGMPGAYCTMDAMWDAFSGWDSGWKRKIEKWFVRSTSWKQFLAKCALPAEIFSSRPRTNLLQTCYKFWICNRGPDPDYKSEQILIFVASLYGANVATNTFFRFYVFTQCSVLYCTVLCWTYSTFQSRSDMSYLMLWFL